MEKIKNILNNKKCLKLILGAGNENLKEILKLVFVYSKAGFNMFDVCAKKEAVDMVKNALKLAEREGLICTSVGLQEDVHVIKSLINKQHCIQCGKCIQICPQDAIFMEEEKYIIDERKCIGCLKCKDICQTQAIITEHKYKQPYTMLLPLISEDIDCVEFHCSVDNTENIIDNLNKIKSVYKGIISICLDRSKLGDDTIIKLLKEITSKEAPFSFIIQTDGKPMSGGIDDYNSTLQTVAFAQLINSYNIPSYILLSGGTNSKSTKLAKECNVNINGAAIGSFARQLVREEISRNDFFNNETLINSAVSKAKKLASDLLLYL